MSLAVEALIADLHERLANRDEGFKPFLDNTLELGEPRGLRSSEIVQQDQVSLIVGAAAGWSTSS